MSRSARDKAPRVRAWMFARLAISALVTAAVLRGGEASACEASSGASADRSQSAETQDLVSPASRPARTLPAQAPTDEAARQALVRGLEYLARQQATEPDGSLPRGRALQAPQDRADAHTAPVAVTALAALAYMAGGSTPERGPHGREVARAIDFLLAHTELDPQAATRGYISKKGDSISRMHGHGLATLALAQAYGMSPKSERGALIERALEEAVALIERSQSVEGGWSYEPVKGAHEGSITICCVQALRAAHNAGLHVDSATVARAFEYVQRSQKEDGSFRYALGDDHSTVALTAAAISTLHAAGTYAGPVLDEGYAYLFRSLALREQPAGGASSAADAPWTPASDGKHVYCAEYERLYLAQALWQNVDAHVFASWIEKERPRVLSSQGADGAWTDARFGSSYATAMTCLFLALPEDLLPIFQR